MAVTITVTSPTGSELALRDLLLAADVDAALAADANNYWLATSGTFLGGAVELRFKSSGGDLVYDGGDPDLPAGGTLDSLEVFSVSLNMVVATVTDFSHPALLLHDHIFAQHPLIAAFIFEDTHSFAGDTGNDKFVVDNAAGNYGAGTLNGGDGDDYLQAGNNDDTLNGGKGDDILVGAFGYDKLNGGEGDDILRPGQGFNDVSGGDGFDTADYSDIETTGIFVDATNKSITASDFSVSDSFDSVEKFIGTKFADKFVGDASARIFEGGEGNDTVLGGAGDEWATGGAGADIMDGGAGTDTLTYLGAVLGVTVTLGAPNAQITGSGGEAQGDKIKNFENILGGDGKDKLTGNALDNRLFGIDSDDTLLGMAGNDRLSGGKGNDIIDGGVGDDLIEGGDGPDKITGNAGIDTITYENSAAAVTINLLTNVNKSGEAEGDTLFTVENIVGSKFDDVITGNLLDNVIEGGAGADTINGGGGKDTASYENSDDAVQIDLSIGSAAQTSTGHGNGDKLIGILNLLGSIHDDKLTGDTNNNTIDGGAGIDELDGGGGIDTLSYATSNGGVGIQLDANGAGTGSGGDAQGDTYKNFENVTGSAFDDALTGNNIVNVLKGGAGNDFIEGYGGADIIDGGDGTDGASYENSDASVTVNLATNVNTGGHAQGDKLSGIEDLYGSDFQDKLTGNTLANLINAGSEDDFIDGGSGNDTLHGGGGKDTILGNSGDDLIDGSGDADVMDGGSGIDTLSYAPSGAVKVKLGEGSAAQIQSAATKVTVNGVADIELGGNSAEGDSVKNFENLVGSAFDDVLIGNSLANKIEGGIGKDNIDGGKGNDNIFGGFGNDTIFGNDGDDVIEGGAGADKMDGGLGKSTLSYAADTAGVTVSLIGGVASGGDGAGDTFTNFQNVRGGSGDDFVSGDANANVLEGGGGDDTLFGNGGKDVLDGGADFDFASFEGVTKAVTVALKANGVASTVTSVAAPGSAAGTILKNIEGLLGSDFKDKFTGNAFDNKIAGLDGDDWIEGGAGADELNGGAGIDTLSYAGSKAGVTAIIFGANSTPNFGGDAEGDDVVNFENIIGSKFDDILEAHAQGGQVNIIKGGAGNDVIVGGEGGDFLYGEAGTDTLSYFLDTAGVAVILKGSAAADVSGSTNAGNHAAGDVAIGFENLRGGAGKDMLIGDAEANVIDGGDADDILDGMGGVDTVSYASAGSKVTVKLGDNGAETTGNGTAGENDSIKNFENITGSTWNDTLYGNNLANVLFGGQGNDTLIGGGGADKLDGGDNFDAVDYSMLAANQGITVKLGTNGAAATVKSSAGSPASGDVLINIESVKGGAGNDKLTGNNLGYTLDGGDGDDYLEAGTASGQLHGGNGNDTASFASYGNFIIANLETSAASAGFTISGIEHLIGSAFNDYLTGDGGVNKISGGAGNDFVVGGGGADILDGGSNLSTTELQVATDYGDTVNYEDIGAGTDLVVVLGNNGAKTVVTASGVDASFANGEEIMNFESVRGGSGNDKLTGNAGNNTIRGGDGDDWIEGGAGNDVLSGGNGVNTVAYTTATAGVTVDLNILGYQDTVGAGKDFILSFKNLIGSAKNDKLAGDFQANLIEGGDGNDVIEGRSGGDTLKGGIGIDTVSYAGAQSGVTVDLNLQDGVTKQSGIDDENNDVLTGFENLTGGEWHDKLIGDVNSNTIFGLGGNDTINGGRGADILDGGAGIDWLSYEDDNNSVTVKLGLNGTQSLVTGISHDAGDKVSNFENIKGGMGNDILTGNNLDNVILGGDGDDIIDGGLSNDTLDGGAGINTLSYASINVGVSVSLSNSNANTAAGNDNYQNFHNLIGTSKDDTLIGNGGDNVIEGGGGNDALTGGAGNDILEGGAGNDIINGGADSDTASYKSAASAVTVNLAVTTQQNTVGAGLDTITFVENLLGSKFNDMLTGDGSANEINGGAGNDIIVGGGGGDKLFGDLGNDSFRFNNAAEGGDIIYDFGTGIDKIQISKSGFFIPATVALNGTGANNFASEYFVSGSGAVADKAHGQFVFDTDTFELFWDDDGTGGNAAVLITDFDNGHILMATDFTLI